MRMRWVGALCVTLALVCGRGLVCQTPSDAPSAVGVYRVGNGVSAPKVLYQPEPEFSELARKKKIAGSCKLALVVGTDGHVQDVRVVRSIAEGQPAKLRAAAVSLDGKAIEAARQYRFEPTMVAGKAVRVELEIEVNFQIF